MTQTGPTEFKGLELAVGDVRGARGFSVDPLGRLTGINYKQVWTPGENVAICHKNGDDMAAMLQKALDWNTKGSGVVYATVPDPPKPEHKMPQCQCGFYAYYDGSNDYGRTSPVVGIVQGFGETIVGTRGFRVYKAKILALHINKEIDDLYEEGIHALNTAQRNRVLHNYRDIPFFDDYERMMSEYPPVGGPNDLTPETDPDFWTRWPQV